jgi:hypothetical protein
MLVPARNGYDPPPSPIELSVRRFSPMKVQVGVVGLYHFVPVSGGKTIH